MEALSLCMSGKGIAAPTETELHQRQIGDFGISPETKGQQPNWKELLGDDRATSSRTSTHTEPITQAVTAVDQGQLLNTKDPVQCPHHCSHKKSSQVASGSKQICSFNCIYEELHDGKCKCRFYKPTRSPVSSQAPVEVEQRPSTGAMEAPREFQRMAESEQFQQPPPKRKPKLRHGHTMKTTSLSKPNRGEDGSLPNSGPMPNVFVPRELQWKLGRTPQDESMSTAVMRARER
jgi:hypothetical protein